MVHSTSWQGVRIHVTVPPTLFYLYFLGLRCFCGKFGLSYLGKAQQLQERRYPFLPVCVCVQYFSVSKQWYGCQCLEFWAYVQMLMSAIAHRGCTDTVREPPLEVDSGEKNPLPHRGLEPASVLRLAYQLSYFAVLTLTTCNSSLERNRMSQWKILSASWKLVSSVTLYTMTKPSPVRTYCSRTAEYSSCPAVSKMSSTQVCSEKKHEKY